MVAQIERTLCALGAGRNAAWGVVSGTGHITRAGTLHGLCSREHNPCAKAKKSYAYGSVWDCSRARWPAAVPLVKPRFIDIWRKPPRPG